MIPEKIRKSIRKFNEEREKLIKLDVYANFITCVEEYLDISKTVLGRYSNNSGIIEFSKEVYQATGASVTVKVKRKFISVGEVGVTYTVGGSTIGTTGGFLVWADGDTSDKEIVIPIVDGLNIESADFLELTLKDAAGGAYLGGISRSEVVINSTDVISFSQNSFSVSEKRDSVRLRVRRSSNDFAKTVSVGYKTINGTATKKKDYVKTTGVLTWDAGDESDKFITVPINLDKNYLGEEDKPDEYFYVKLRRPTGGASIDSPNKAEVRILNSPRGEIGFKEDVRFLREGGTEKVIVSRTGRQLGKVKVDYEISFVGSAQREDIDVESLTGTLKFPDKEGEGGVSTETTELEIEIPVVLGDGIENEEEFLITLSNPSKGAKLRPGDQEITCIIEKNFPYIGIEDAEFNVSEGQELMLPITKVEGVELAGNIYPMAVTYTVANDTAVGKNVSPDIYYDIFPITGSGVGISAYPAITGCDYIIPSETAAMTGRIVFTDPVPKEVKTFPIGIIDDNLFETPESFTVSLSNYQNAVKGLFDSTTVNIGLDEEGNVLDDPTDDSEGYYTFPSPTQTLFGYEDETLSIAVQRRGGSGSAVVPVSYAGGTAQINVDFILENGTVTFTGESEEETQYVKLKILRPEAQGKIVVLAITTSGRRGIWPYGSNIITLEYLGTRDVVGEPPAIIIDPENIKPFPVEEIDSIIQQISDQKKNNVSDYRRLYDSVWWSWLVLQMELNEIIQEGTMTKQQIFDEMELDEDFFYDSSYNPDTFDENRDRLPSDYRTPPPEIRKYYFANWRRERFEVFEELMPNPYDMLSSEFRLIMQYTFDVPIYDFKEKISSFIKTKTLFKKKFAHIDARAVINAIDDEMYLRRAKYLQNFIFGPPDPLTSVYYPDGVLDARKNLALAFSITNTNLGFGTIPFSPSHDDDLLILASRQLESSYFNSSVTSPYRGTIIQHAEGCNEIFKLVPTVDTQEFQSFRNLTNGLFVPPEDKDVSVYDYLNYRYKFDDI
jgi:hypothetical protein